MVVYSLMLIVFVGVGVRGQSADPGNVHAATEVPGYFAKSKIWSGGLNTCRGCNARDEPGLMRGRISQEARNWVGACHRDGADTDSPATSCRFWKCFSGSLSDLFFLCWMVLFLERLVDFVPSRHVRCS